MPARPLTAFGRNLEQLLAARSLSLRGFAERVGMSPGWVSRVKRLTIAAEHIEPWADALGLQGTERERFVLLAWLTHAPPFVCEHVVRLERDLAVARERTAGAGRRRTSPRLSRS